MAKLKSSLWKLYGCNHNLVNVTEYLCHKSPWICSICFNHNPVLSSIMTYHQVCNKSNTTGATSKAGTAHPSEHLSPQPVLVGFTLFNIPFSFGHCIVCPSIYGFWLPLWYLQTILHFFSSQYEKNIN